MWAKVSGLKQELSDEASALSRQTDRPDELMSWGALRNVHWPQASQAEQQQETEDLLSQSERYDLTDFFVPRAPRESRPQWLNYVR